MESVTLILLWEPDCFLQLPHFLPPLFIYLLYLYLSNFPVAYNVFVFWDVMYKWRLQIRIPSRCVRFAVCPNYNPLLSQQFVTFFHPSPRLFSSPSTLEFSSLSIMSPRLYTIRLLCSSFRPRSLLSVFESKQYDANPFSFHPYLDFSLHSSSSSSPYYYYSSSSCPASPPLFPHVAL